MAFSHACSEENFIHNVLELVPTPFVAAAGFGQAWLHSLLVRRESRGPGKVSMYLQAQLWLKQVDSEARTSLARGNVP